MKTLVVYYSKTGNTKLIAENIAEELNADLLALKPKREIKSTGFMLYFRGGFQSMIKKRIKLNAIEFNLNDYDLIIIGTPVWAWRLNPVVRSFLRTSKFQNKKFGLFCCCGDSGANILKEMREILKGNEILGEIEFIEPLKNETELSIDRAKQWVKGLNKL